MLFLPGGLELSEVLPDADPTAFSAWLQAELGQFTQLMNNISDFGAYGATLIVARSFQVAGFDHLKKLGCVSHNFPSIDDVHGASRDRLCKNVVVWFLTKFWMEGGVEPLLLARRRWAHMRYIRASNSLLFPFWLVFISLLMVFIYFVS